MELSHKQKNAINNITSQVTSQLTTKLLRWFVIVVFISTLLNLILNASQVGFDSTDDIENNRRSEMSIRVDHLTGCQYLATSLGGLTPRMSASGTQLGCQAS